MATESRSDPTNGSRQQERIDPLESMLQPKPMIQSPHRIPQGSHTVAGGLSAANTTGNIHNNRCTPPAGAHIHNVQTRPANRKMAKPWQDKAWGRKSQVTGPTLQPKVAERRQNSTSQTWPANHANTANATMHSQAILDS